MARKTQILVIGHNDNGCTPEHEKTAYDTGAAIARSGAVLISGGLGGVMRASCRGAREAGGLTVGIIPQDAHSEANEFCDVVLPSGMGLTRDFLNALAADGIIIIGGGSGTLSEVCAAYMYRRPMVAVRGTGGVADRYGGTFVDYRENIMIGQADSPDEAVRSILEAIT
ncbi:Rossmann fold nucleotide-binding protein [Cenarchaeum symbiosum A]|uniref:Rossmann fold nucleotide-binding protein n=1 Tax=Cenarchaeum symbiosum (strain A) TaxID=414004 RepID=A0RUN0_CENSY|nr:Rossmann fold nucleotide-binding protein [Cenarchaeum symbiosum A]